MPIPLYKLLAGDGYFRSVERMNRNFSALKSSIETLASSGQLVPDPTLVTQSELDVVVQSINNEIVIIQDDISALVRTVGDAAPSADTWVQGDIVWNNAPVAGGNIGWVCVESGTPGTWRSWGAISA